MAEAAPATTMSSGIHGSSTLARSTRTAVVVGLAGPDPGADGQHDDVVAGPPEGPGQPVDVRRRAVGGGGKSQVSISTRIGRTLPVAVCDSAVARGAYGVATRTIEGEAHAHSAEGFGQFSPP